MLDTKSYLWDVTNDNGQMVSTADTLAFQFTPLYAGNYTAKLTASDSDGGSSSVSEAFIVKPVVVINPPAAADAGSVVTLTPSGSTPVAPAGLLRGDSRSVERVYQWEFVGVPAGHVAADFVIGSLTDRDLRFLPTVVGDYEVKLIITDQFYTTTGGTKTLDDSISGETTHTLSVAAAATIAISSPVGPLTEGDRPEFSISGLPDVVEGVTRSYAWTVSPAGGGSPVTDGPTFAFQANDDGNYTIGLTVTDTVGGKAFVRTAIDVSGNYGTLDWNADGTFIYTLDRANVAVQALLPGQSLTDTFAYTLTDGTAPSTPAVTITINGFNDAPDAIDDSVPLDLDVAATATAALLGNDLALDDGCHGPSQRR